MIFKECFDPNQPVNSTTFIHVGKKQLDSIDGKLLQSDLSGKIHQTQT